MKTYPIGTMDVPSQQQITINLPLGGGSKLNTCLDMSITFSFRAN